MKKRELKERIIGAYKAEIPDMRRTIIASCEKECQAGAELEEELETSKFEKQMTLGHVFRRVAAACASFAIFALGLLLGANMQGLKHGAANTVTETFVFFDVNPSVELRMDADNKVTECLAGNDDAETVLSGLKLVGVDMHTALTSIVGSMYVNGYLTEDSNSILISVETSDEKKTAALLNDIAKKINSVFEKSEMNCSIIAQSVKVDENLKHRAETNGVSVGKMHLLDKMGERFGGLSEDALKRLSEFSIRDLNLIYLQRPSHETPPVEDIISGTVNVEISSDEAMEAVMAEIGKTLNEVECYRTFFLPSKNGESRVVYAVVLMLYDDPSVYKFEVDCQSGEVVRMDGDS